jgi:hypothetical protein
VNVEIGNKEYFGISNLCEKGKKKAKKEINDRGKLIQFLSNNKLRAMKNF